MSAQEAAAVFGQRIWITLRSHKRAAIINSGLTYSVIVAIWESFAVAITATWPDVAWPRLSSLFAVLALAGISIVAGLYQTLPAISVTIRQKPLDLTMVLLFGDLFSSPGVRVIPANEYFDGELGDQLVSHTSIHGQLLIRHFPDPAIFHAAVDADLEKLKAQSLEEKARALVRNRKYAIGETPVLLVEKQKYFLLSLCKNDVVSGKASCDVPQLWTALAGLWKAIRERANGETASVPLIGSGHSGVGIPPTQLANLIVTSFVDAHKRNPSTSTLRLVLPMRLLEEIDLTAIKEAWD